MTVKPSRHLWPEAYIPMEMKLPPEQLRLRSAARELAKSEVARKAAEIDRTEAYPFDNVAALKSAGFMGYTIPMSYGGRGGSFFEAALIFEEAPATSRYQVRRSGAFAKGKWSCRK